MFTFFLRRHVDWSLLTNGFHIPTEFICWCMPCLEANCIMAISEE